VCRAHTYIETEHLFEQTVERGLSRSANIHFFEATIISYISTALLCGMHTFAYMQTHTTATGIHTCTHSAQRRRKNKRNNLLLQGMRQFPYFFWAWSSFIFGCKGWDILDITHAPHKPELTQTNAHTQKFKEIMKGAQAVDEGSSRTAWYSNMSCNQCRRRVGLRS